MSMTDTAPDELEPGEGGALLEDLATDPDKPERFDPQRLIDWISAVNIAEDIDESELNRIGQKVLREFEIDEGSRAEWLERNRVALDLAMQVAQAKTFPWPRSSNIVYPLMTTAAIQFAARAYPAIVSGRDVVKGIVIGNDDGVQAISPEDQTPLFDVAEGQQPVPKWEVPPGEKRRRADRIADHMSWQLLDEMESWEEDTDKLLHILPIAGCAFRKSYFDPGEQCNISELVFAQNLVVNYWARSMERAPRISELVPFYPDEIEEKVRAGVWLDLDYGKASGDEEHTDSDDEDAPHEFIEQHRRLDLDEDGYAEPYIVTVHKATGKVARIVARYDEEGVRLGERDGEQIIARIEPVHYYTKYDFMPSPEGAIYGVGFGQLLGPINAAVNAVLNQLIDAGTLQNVGGGFIGRGLSMRSGNIRFKMGEYVAVNAPGAKIRDAIVPMEFPGPSPVLFQLLGFLTEAGREIASVKDILTGQAQSADMSPTTLLALIEQGLKVFTAIYKRVHRAAKKEYAKLYRLNRIYLEDRAQYQVGEEWKEITREDYARGSGVVPVSDPSMITDMQKLARGQFLMGFRADPLMDGAEILRRALDAAQIPDVEDLFAKQQQPDPAVVASTKEIELKGLKLMAEIEEIGQKMETDASTARAQQTKTYADAILALAKADTENGELDLAWTQQQLEALKVRMEAVNRASEPVAAVEPSAVEPVQ